MPLSSTAHLALALIAKASITPRDEGCQAMIAKRLQAIDFNVQTLRFGNVDNLWAVHGSKGPLFCFAGHTDVVPPGPEKQWRIPPFAPVVEDGILYGRGAADMKGSLAAMVTAVERFISQSPRHPGRLAFLLTSDEEGPAVDGTAKVIDWLNKQKEKINWCLVGEPSSSKRIGDTVKHGRRGSLSGKLTIKGQQGHIAYPHLADNAIHRAVPALAALMEEQWDKGNKRFPPTALQFSHIKAGAGASNVIPGHIDIAFNFRFSNASTAQDLRSRFAAMLDHYQLEYDLKWTLNGEPFLTSAKSKLVTAVVESVGKITGVKAKLSTDGGTSDGRFIAPTGSQVVELGPINATIHQVDECVSVNDLDMLAIMYEDIVKRLLLKDT